jgi:hypothetical protein
MLGVVDAAPGDARSSGRTSRALPVAAHRPWIDALSFPGAVALHEHPGESRRHGDVA